MNTCSLSFFGAALQALGSGGLWWPDQGVYCVSDLHLGKSERIARRGGALLPPYETEETLARLEADLALTSARIVIALGDSFDDDAATEALSLSIVDRLQRLQAGRRWIWIAGNHDPAPLGLGGEHLAEVTVDGLEFRHAADPAARGEVSGHYHPKALLALRGRSLSRPCFLVDNVRLILPAFGAYTGGLRSSDAALCALMSKGAEAILTGPRPVRIPMPRGR